jgi:hypothetical protein
MLRGKLFRMRLPIYAVVIRPECGCVFEEKLRRLLRISISAWYG